MSQSPINDFTNVTMSNLRTLIDVNTIIGDPVNTAGGVTIIPFSKVSFGYGSGGADLPANANEKFAGGSGGGVTIQPLGFIIIKGEDVEVIQLQTAKNTNDRIVNAGADIANKLLGLIPSKSKDSVDNIAAEGKASSTKVRESEFAPFAENPTEEAKA